MWKEVLPSGGGEVQKNNTSTESSQQKNSEDRKLARVNKAARKKEKLTCYRCGVSGHFVVDCTTILCDICLKPGHTDAACPLLLVAKPIMNIYGVCHSKLMFFEMPGSSSVLAPPRLEISRTGMVKVTNGELCAKQVSQQMKRLVSETYNWDPIRVDDNSYQVEFPRREDLQRLLTFGVSKVCGSKCLLEFEECIKPAPQGIRLQKRWIIFSGIPEILLNDFLIVWSLGSLIGKTEKVDMTFTRKRGIARLLVMVLDVEQIPDFAPWSYDGVHYDLDVEVEEVVHQKSQDGDVLMADGEDRDRDRGDANQDKIPEAPTDNISPALPKTDKPTVTGGAPSSSHVHMAELRFGSFKVMSRLGEEVGAMVFDQPMVQEGYVALGTSNVRGSTMQIPNEKDDMQVSAAITKVDSNLSIAADLKEKHMDAAATPRPESTLYTSTVLKEKRMMSATRADSVPEQECSNEATPLPSHNTVIDEPTSWCKDNRFSNNKQQIYSFISDNPIFDSPLDQHYVQNATTGKRMEIFHGGGARFFKSLANSDHGPQKGYRDNQQKGSGRGGNRRNQGSGGGYNDGNNGGHNDGVGNYEGGDDCGSGGYYHAANNNHTNGNRGYYNNQQK
ncbi:hypothetical protein D1007_48508 [Hordeum vulgare]|nr:hypothetical protein D1007_48508 [Hordeum vulgare]